ncbi:PAS domain S-box protein [Candidatus Woesebacteria bacterium]|nr:PAS domain S-box protein [Candidatus Woesebacteria bacterium]
MNENILLAPVMFFSLIFSVLLLVFCVKKALKDRQVFYFSHFLIVVSVFSAVQLLNYFDFLPKVIDQYLFSILLFLMHYFLLFQYFFVASYLNISKRKIVGVLFTVAFLLWTVLIIYPPNAIAIVQGQNQNLQLAVASISMSPAFFFAILVFFQFFFRKLSVSRNLFYLLMGGLIIPILVTYYVINLQLNQSVFSLDLIFTSLSISMYFYTFVLYFDEKKKIISSLKEKTAFFAVLLILVPLTFRSMYIYTHSREILLDAAIEVIEIENQFQADGISKTIESFKKESIILSELDSLNRSKEESFVKDEVVDFFSGYLKANPSVKQIRYIDSSGFELIKLSQGENGITIIPESELSDRKEDEYFSELQSLVLKSAYISKIKLERDGVTGRIINPYSPVIVFSAPVYLGSEKNGVVVIDVLASQIFSDSTNSHRVVPRFKYIADENGFFLQHSDALKTWGSPEELNSGITISHEIPQLWDLMREGKEQSAIVSNGDESFLYSFTSIDINSNGTVEKIFLISEKNVNEIFSDINSLSYNLLSSSVIIAFISFVAFYIFISYLVSPILFLKSAVENFEFVDEDKLKLKTSDEISELAETFANMVQRVKDSKNNIEKQVKAQTLKVSENAQRLEDQRTAMINLIEDIDFQRQVTLDQATDLKKFKLAIDSVSELIVITDHEGTVIYANPAIEKVTGFTQKEAIGSKAGKLWGRQMKEEWYKKFWYVISERKEKFIGQITNKKKDGSLFIAEITVQPVLDDIGTIKHYVSVQRDITKEVQVDRMKTDFISLASHQLRTPLSAMKWFLEMLRNGELGKMNVEQLDAIENVDKSNDRMIALVNALLNISRIESGRIIVNPEPTDIVLLVKQTLLSVKDRFEEKKQTIQYKADIHLPQIPLDRDLITQF